MLGVKFAEFLLPSTSHRRARSDSGHFFIHPLIFAAPLIDRLAQITVLAVGCKGWNGLVCLAVMAHGPDHFPALSRPRGTIAYWGQVGVPGRTVMTQVSHMGPESGDSQLLLVGPENCALTWQFSMAVIGQPGSSAFFWPSSRDTITGVLQKQQCVWDGTGCEPGFQRGTWRKASLGTAVLESFAFQSLLS